MPFYRGTRYPLLGNVGGVKYLLRDEFTDTRAAGAVNGTPATPGPGTRVVVDTGSKLSIGSGVASFTPAASMGDPGLWYAALSRVAGLVLKLEWTLATRQQADVGWDSGQSGGLVQSFSCPDGTGQLNARDNGLTAIGTLAAATSYELACVLRASGAHYLIKGGAYTQWSLLWPGNRLAADPLYPALVNRYATYTSSYIRVPDITWSPTPLVSDSFDRANGAIGTSDGAGCEETAARTPAWAQDVGTWTIATNKGVCSTLAGGLGIATLETGNVNHITTDTVARTGNELGVVLRYADADNYIRAIHDGTNCKLIKRVATVETDVISAAVAIGAGEIRVIPDGTSFSLYLNNAQVGATSTINDAALQTSSLAGLYSTNVANTFDDFYTFSRTGYNILDAW